MVKDAMEKISELAATLFEKATEMRFFLHFLCIVIYLELGLFLITGKPLHLTVIWSETEYFEVGNAILIALGYFFLMGYFFRLVYALTSLVLFRLGQYVHSNKKRWRDIPGMVHEEAILQDAYDTKDNEPLRALDAHKEACRRNRKETRELAYLSFSALALSLACHFLVPNNFLALSNQWLTSVVGAFSAVTTSLLLLLPLLLLIWIDATDDFERDEYLSHVPLYEKLKKKKQEARNAQEMPIRFTPPIRT